ncbi:MAG: SMC-Scp complex subunit ScpB [Patescibacteria group bacterium]
MIKEIEAILFWRSEPVTISWLAKALGISADETQHHLDELEKIMSDRGVVLMRQDDQVMLATAPLAAELVKRLTTEELSTELSRAALETLTIVLYDGPIGRPQIDYIRGVNSSFTLRQLLIRGLVERYTDPQDNRVFLYRPTISLLADLGITKIENLPDYQSVKEKLKNIRAQNIDQSHIDDHTNNN